MPPSGAAPSVAILLGTYQGERYLGEQLDSLVAQTHTDWRVWASDDGSKDGTLALLRAFQHRWGADRVSISQGPAKGFVANFLALVCNPDIHAHHYAYSDQDDVWEADKLARALAWLETIPAGTPALYCGRTRLVDADNKDFGLSPLFAKPPCFANALVQSIAGGNTMVFNHAARELLRKAGKDLSVVTHDWWTYLVVSGCGGHVFYDSYPSLRYRQHEGNLVGMNATWKARLSRLFMLFQGHFRDANDRNIQALLKLEMLLTRDNQLLLAQFSKARNRGLIPRLIGLRRSGVYRQTFLDNLGLIAGSIFKRI